MKASNKLWRCLRFLFTWMLIVIISVCVYTLLDKVRPLTDSPKSLDFQYEEKFEIPNKFGNGDKKIDDGREEVYLDIHNDNDWDNNKVTDNGGEDKGVNDDDAMKTHDDIGYRLEVHESDDENIGDEDNNDNEREARVGIQQSHADNVLKKAANGQVTEVAKDTASHRFEQTEAPEKMIGSTPDSLTPTDTWKLPPYAKRGAQDWTITEKGLYSPSVYSPPPHEVPKQRFPKAIIIGVGKCGTRALIEFLKMHPFIVTARSEIHFFDSDANFSKGLGWYKAQMPFSYSNQITLEKTPSYIWSERAVEEIYKLDAGMKLIVIMKDPVSRVISQIIRGQAFPRLGIEDMLLSQENGTLKVNSNLKTVDLSIYFKYLNNWLKKFPRSQFHFVESKEFVTDPAKEIQKIEKFLNLPPKITSENFYYNTTRGFYCMRPLHVNKIECLSEGKGKPHPKLDPALEKKLYDFFRPHNEELFKMLDRRFSWNQKPTTSG